MVGDYYGRARGQENTGKIVSVSINLRSHGDALFISSCYPDGFQTGLPRRVTTTPAAR